MEGYPLTYTPYTPTYKENVAELILHWVETNEQAKIITIKGELDIAVLASRISKLDDTSLEY